MRVTQFTTYNNFLLNQQNTLSELNKVTQDLSTGKKIQNSYDNPTIFVNDLKFEEKLTSFTQIKKSASFAQTFANETDTTMNDIVKTLDSFKTKLLDAANDTNNETSREAIVNELNGDLEHLKDLANTSIGGKYIFSGSKFNTKPINDEYQYEGNGEKVKAFLGAGVEREYNIDGKTLFLGKDNDYKKHLGLNVVQYDKMKQNPEFVVRGSDGKLYIDKDNPSSDSDDVPTNEPITADSEIRRLTGVEDIDNGDGSYSDGTSYFYVKGRKSNGESIDTKFSLTNSAKVSDLLNKIGEVYGNTATNKVVDVSLNEMGQIQIKDINSGKMITDFFMVASDTDENSIKDLAKNGDYVVNFQRSDFNSIRNEDTITANNKYFDNRIFEFKSTFKLIDNSRKALSDDKLQNVIGQQALRSSDGTIQTISSLHLSGTDTDGNSVSDDLSIDSNTTMQDLIDKIKNDYGDVDVSLEDGKLIIKDNTISKTETSNLSISIEAEDSNGNALQAFRSDDDANFNELFMNKEENKITSNVSQIIKDKKIYYKDGNKIIENNPSAQQYATDNTTIADTTGNDTFPKTMEVRFRDKNGAFKVADIVLDDGDSDGDGKKGSYFEIDGNKYYIYDSKGNTTPAHDNITTTTTIDPVTCKACQKENLQKGVTFSQLNDVMSMLVSDNLPASDNADDYKTAVANAKKEIEAKTDNFGRFTLKDKNNTPSKIDISMYTDDNSISFQENNALTIDEPQTNFFDTLQKAIEAVKNGNNYPNGDSSNPRNFGIQGAIEAIDHLNDHIRRSHAKIGAVSNEFQMSIERVETLTTHVKTLQSENIDTDIGEASMRLNSLKMSYQALLASIGKVSNLTLLNYLK